MTVHREKHSSLYIYIPNQPQMCFPSGQTLYSYYSHFNRRPKHKIIQAQMCVDLMKHIHSTHHQRAFLTIL